MYESFKIQYTVIRMFVSRQSEDSVWPPGKIKSAVEHPQILPPVQTWPIKYEKYFSLCNYTTVSLLLAPPTFNTYSWMQQVHACSLTCVESNSRKCRKSQTGSETDKRK